MAEHIVAVFRTNDEALAATTDLESAGIPASAIRRYAKNGSAHQDVASTTQTSSHSSGGFWAWLFGEQSETTHSTHATDDDAYDRSVAAGSVVVSVTVEDDSKIHQAIAALEAHHPADLEESSDEVGEQSHTAPFAAHSTAGTEVSDTETTRAGSVNPVSTERHVGAGGEHVGPATTASSTAGLAETTSPRTAGAATDREEVIPLSEEQLQIGKRAVDRGTTHIRRYVVEKPVEESITLRGEKVTVERRQPIGTSAAPGVGAFEERVVEVRETAEEPVVSKSAHVAEEVVVAREATERTETIRDTVRREDVEVTNGVSEKK